MIRSFAAKDYPAFAAINNAIYPLHPTTAEAEREGDADRLTDPTRPRYVFEDEAGEVVGSIEYRPRETDTSQYEFELFVHPDRQGQGYGKALYEMMMEQLAQLQATELRADEVKEDLRGVRFLQERGFTEVMRFWQSHLDVAAFDPARFAQEEAHVREQGIVARTLRELQDDPQRDRKLYELVCAVSQDVPSADSYTAPDFTDFCRDLPDPATSLPDMYFVALHGDRYVGLHLVTPRDGTDHLRTAMTGVRREYRRKGIALALKLRGIAYAKAGGHPVMRTMNQTGNTAILALNDRLGFVWQPAWIQMQKRL